MPSSSPAVLAQLQWNTDQKFKSVAIRFKSKAALDPDYGKPTYAPPDPAFWTIHNCNIGVVLGPKLGGPVDVDIDALGIIDIIDAFFPLTDAVFGRASKPRSHRIYRVNGEYPKKVFADPLTKKVILELRGDGGYQTVFPGSLHESSGELIEWTRGAPPTIVIVVTPDELDRAGKLSAIAYLIRTYVWIEGMRDQGSLYFAGMLFKLDWSLDDVLAVFRIAAGSDFDHKAQKRIERTHTKHAAGGVIAGSLMLKKLKLVDPAVVDCVYSWAGAPGAIVVDDYNERFAAGMIGNLFRIVNTDVAPGDTLTIMTKRDFLDFTIADRVAIVSDTGKSKSMPKAELWLRSASHRRFRSLQFLPGVNNDDLPDGVLNLWTGWPLQPNPDGCCDAWLELLWTVVCGENEKNYRWTLTWFANIVRDPMRRALTALVLISDLEGAGKTLLLTYFGKILGSGYVPVHSSKHVTGPFNRHLATCLLLHSEEALYPGNHEHAAIIRSLISDPYRMFEPKFSDAVRVANFLRLTFSTNKQHAAAPQPSDRRHTALYLENRKISPELRDRVMTEMEGDGPAKLFHLLLTMEDYDPELIRTNIKNEALLNLTQIAAEPYQQWWCERLRDGQVLDADLSSCKKPHDEPWPSIVSFTAMCASMRLFLRINGQRRQFNSAQFRSELEKMVNVRFMDSRPRFNYIPAEDAPPEFKGLGDVNMRQYAIMNLPSLEDCRTAFNLFLDPTGTTKIDFTAPEGDDDDDDDDDLPPNDGAKF